MNTYLYKGDDLLKIKLLETLTRNILRSKNIDIEDEILGESHSIDIEEYADLIPEDSEVEINNSNILIAAGEIEIGNDNIYQVYVIYKYNTVPYYIVLIDEDEEKQTYSVLEGIWLN